jgi:hypothetical protein
MNNQQIMDFVNFIQKQYFNNGNNCFCPEKNNIFPYFIGLNHQSFFSFYYDSEYITKDTSILTHQKIICTMTSRPVTILIKNNTINCYYVDYLCVDKNKRKQGIAEQMIQTHEYNQRHLNKNIQISLFKREGQLTGIVPLCVYTTFCYSIEDININNQNINVIACNKININKLIDYLQDIQQSKVFDIIIHSDFSNIIELILTQNIYIYYLLYKDDIIGSYFFKKTCTYIKKNEEVLTCYASVNSSRKNNLFVNGFYRAVRNILEGQYSQNSDKLLKREKKEKKENSIYKYLAIENISHNSFFINDLSKPIIKTPTAFFFYNYIFPTINSNKTLIII